MFLVLACWLVYWWGWLAYLRVSDVLRVLPVSHIHCELVDGGETTDAHVETLPPGGYRLRQLRVAGPWQPGAELQHDLVGFAQEWGLRVGVGLQDRQAFHALGFALVDQTRRADDGRALVGSLGLGAFTVAPHAPSVVDTAPTEREIHLDAEGAVVVDMQRVLRHRQQCAIEEARDGSERRFDGILETVAHPLSDSGLQAYAHIYGHMVQNRTPAATSP